MLDVCNWQELGRRKIEILILGGKVFDFAVFPWTLVGSLMNASAYWPFPW